MEEVEHIFIGQNWHVFNEMFPFYRSLRRDKLFFTDVSHQPFPDLRPLEALHDYRPRHKRGIIYFSLWGHLKEYGLRKMYERFRLVRVFHGLMMPWGAILKKNIPPDMVILAASRLDQGIWQRCRPECRVEVVGWAKGEEFLKAHGQGSPVAKHIIVGSSWCKERSAFEFFEELSKLRDYSVTVTIHPNLMRSNKGLSRRVVTKTFLEGITQLEQTSVKIADVRLGVLPYMYDKSLMLGVESSASVEWLLFDRPIIFLRPSSYLNYGALVSNGNLRNLTEGVSRREDPLHAERRAALRGELMSHVDGLYGERFNELVESLELSLVRE